MRRALKQLRKAGVEPSGDWSIDKRNPVVTLKPSIRASHGKAAKISPEVAAKINPGVTAKASPDAVLQALLEIARECAEELRTIRIEAERLETKAQQARRAACFYAQAQGLVFDDGDFED